VAQHLPEENDALMFGVKVNWYFHGQCLRRCQFASASTHSVACRRSVLRQHRCRHVKSAVALVLIVKTTVSRNKSPCTAARPKRQLSTAGSKTKLTAGEANSRLSPANRYFPEPSLLVIAVF
jgi:hypothetical protein